MQTLTHVHSCRWCHNFVEISECSLTLVSFNYLKKWGYRDWTKLGKWNANIVTSSFCLKFALAPQFVSHTVFWWFKVLSLIMVSLTTGLAWFLGWKCLNANVVTVSKKIFLNVCIMLLVNLEMHCWMFWINKTDHYIAFDSSAYPLPILQKLKAKNVTL